MEYSHLMTVLQPRSPITLLSDPLPESLPGNFDDFLSMLNGPTAITMLGQSSERCRSGWVGIPGHFSISSVSSWR